MSIATIEQVAQYTERATSDPNLIKAWNSAENYISVRCSWPDSEIDEAPESLVQAVLLLTARYLARRASPDGFIGMTEFGPARVPVNDRDVDRLMAPYRNTVLG